MTHRKLAPALLLALVVAACGSDDDSASDLRINHMQVVGSHNSYHVQPTPAVFELLAAFARPLAEAFEYTHVPLQEQFADQGVRQIELDIFYDPDGGLYELPIGLQLAFGEAAMPIPGMDLPGYKVLHVQEIDFETNCKTLIECLVEVKEWSDAHPHHVPIMILIEAKDSAIDDPLDLGFLVPLPIRAAELDILDAEIRSVFPAVQMITPDDVRGGHATLAEAVQSDGWPRLRDARGKVMFALDNGGIIKSEYIDGHPSLRGRVMFTSSGPGEDEAGFVKLNDAIGDFDRIQELVAGGYLVRTRADSPEGREARNDDTMRRDVALASGAHFVSTDYPVPNPDFGTDYQVQMPGGMPVRCNPISAPEECTALSLEDPARLR